MQVLSNKKEDSKDDNSSYLSKLQEIRDQVFVNALESPLFDSKKFSKSFFESMQKIYEKINL